MRNIFLSPKFSVTGRRLINSNCTFIASAEVCAMIGAAGGPRVSRYKVKLHTCGTGNLFRIRTKSNCTNRLCSLIFVMVLWRALNPTGARKKKDPIKLDPFICNTDIVYCTSFCIASRTFIRSSVLSSSTSTKWSSS